MTTESSELDPLEVFKPLTRRELLVATALANGHSNRAIATELGCSIKTIDTHRGHVMKKLNVANNVLLARLAIKTGLVKL